MKSKQRLIVSLIALFIFASMSVGYALYNANVNVSGKATFKKSGKVAITNAVISDYSNVKNPTNPTYTDDKISFSITFNSVSARADFNKEYYATYTITIKNDSFYDYTFSATTFSPSLETSSNTDMIVTYSTDGLEINDVIPSGEERTFNLTINMYPQDTGTFTVEGDSGVTLDEKTDEGSLLASIPKNTTGDLSGGNSYVKVTASVVNSYKSEKHFNFSISNSNFYLVDKDGNELPTYSIDPNSNADYDIYIKVKEGAKFPTDTQNMNIYFEPVDYNKSSMGVVSLKVDVDTTLTDDEPPTISDVTSTFQAQKGNVLVEYTGSDNVGIAHYVIETYKVENDSETLISTNNTVADETSYTVTGLEDGTYYFKVTAVDTSNLTSTASSTEQSFKWTMTVTDNLSNASIQNNKTVDYGEPYDVTISGNGSYNPPASLTIYIGETEDTLTAGTDYTYDSETGALHISSVTSDLTVSGYGRSNGCLVKGTKVKLANGTYKNVEDINYDDLLLVWNYDTGIVTKEYPLWIENEHKTDTYTKISFSDGSYINVVKSHSFYSYDISEFVDFNDTDNFHIGTLVAKLNNNNKLEKVMVTNIENINEEVNYYFVASTRYYNIISNDFITTDGYTDITNLYDFDSNISWSKNRVVKKLRYSYLKDVLPYYMYKGFRAGELAVLLENGNTNLNDFKNYIKTLVTSTYMLKSPITKNNNRYWYVSTDVTTKKLIKEGSYYKLPKTKGVKYWYSTSENKKYKPGSKVKVWTGMHFEIIK